jgi:uncharacterized membrane protein
VRYEALALTCIAALSVAGCASNGGNAAMPSGVNAAAPGRAAVVSAASARDVRIQPSLGGTNSAANTINRLGDSAGTSFLASNSMMHAALWRERSVTDLGTLGGPNSAVEWPVENDHGYVSGISETSTHDPLGESTGWSCHVFLPDGGQSGDTCVAFVWHDNVMHALPNLGGNNGYGAGMNERGQIAGWAETNLPDSTCIAPQQLQFLPVVWNARTLKATPLPTLSVNGKADPDGAATAVNDAGDVVGISGICDQAVGRFTAAHAVLWHRGSPIALKTLHGVSWNTPTAINANGQIVGFLNRPGSADRKGQQNFISVIWNDPWSEPTKIGTLPHDTLSEPTSVNDSGVVLGVSFPSSDVYVWQNGSMTDVTKVVLRKDPQLRLVSVGGINDRGQIAGQACELVSGTCPASNPTFVAVLIEAI